MNLMRMNNEFAANTTLSHYRIVSKIGAGGMGEVWLAEDTRLKRKVALKLLPAELTSDADRVRRFEQEAQAASALNHPNILTIYEIGEINATNYIATEYIEGDTLRHHIQHSRRKLREILETVVQVASALSTAHQAGIIHRDLKPENVMLRPDGIVKVLDFGLAKLSEKVMSTIDSEAATLAKKATDPGTIMGTVQYMSPEQARGKAVDARSDIFSLGIVLYEMLAGRVPFAGESSTDVLAAILDKEPLPLLRFVDDMPPELQRIVTKCLRKERDERYQTMKDVLLDLKELRDELALEAKLEHSIRPATSSSENQQTWIAAGGITKDATRQATSGTSAPNTSSAEYLVSEIRNHKRRIAVIRVLLLFAALAAGYWFLFLRAANTEQIESIAVMPFVNESGNAEVDYLSDGMTETLIKSLSQLPKVAVKSRSTVFYYKGKETSPKKIGEELNVQAVLLGRVGGRGDTVKVNLELVNTQTQNIIWSEQYDRQQADLVSLQSEIARDVSGKLKAKLSGADEAKVTNPATVSPEAYQAYLKGRYYWNRRTAENIRKAIEQFKAATDRDPNYALAYVGLADCYVVLNYYAGTPTSETVPQAKAYAERAIALDDQLAEPHATLGQVHKLSWQWEESEREFKRAIELNPKYATAYHWYSLLLRGLGRVDEGALMIRRAHDLDPLSSVIGVNLSQVYQFQNNHNASIENMLKVIEFDPNYSDVYSILGLSYLKQGRYAEAIANMEKAVELSNRDSFTLVNLGYGYSVTGKRAEAIAIVKEMEEKYARKESSGRYVASVYAGLGDKDKAFEWLEREYQSKGDLTWIRWEIPYESLSDDRRYMDLLRRMNLPR